jgi:hypothetical protein
MIKLLKKEKYLKISCKTDQSDMGSMFVVIKDDPVEYCEYTLINESKHFDLLYKQNINNANIPLKFSKIS